ncbi:flagellar hook-basal body complex protein FliE [Psychromonas sp. Urea-02u-13]|uniref:flagellar hook-basal body complex protein FliE n=1 Tax=Psychromonas sp. Urea-02u-13 TaxID=2058326 RepID=UPI000C34FCFD|nr:flagellar hook-basal body complex protein FliE [Psychromonas sp. Urea-02u-13]PKG39538.1 flagellar hook-basal body complex protein FliE [Psychromonas sp. Urea-02u-13]
MSISAISLQNTSLVQKMDEMKEPVIKHNNFNGASPIDFSKALVSVLDGVNTQQAVATDKINAVGLGKSDDMIGAVVAAQKASLSFSALMQVRNKLLSGFDEIMKMPI